MECRLQQDPQTTGSAGTGDDTPSLEELRREIARLRRTQLKHGHAQELFQERIENAIERLAKRLATPRPRLEAPAGHRPRPAARSVSAAQLRTLVELAQAVDNLKDQAAGGGSGETGSEDSPRSVREGLDLLSIRVGNLQRSFGLDKIPALGRPFDDRLHRAHGVCSRGDLPDGQVVEELLPGYLLGGEVARPALVIVNRLAAAERREDEPKTAGATT